MKLDDIKNHIRDFFRGSDSEEGRRIIDLWYHFFDDKPDKLDELYIEEKEILRKNLFHDIRNKTGIGDKKLNRFQRASSHNKTWHYKMAAGFAVLLLALLPIFLITVEEPVPESVAYRTSNNPTGQSSRITLSDGSTIWLSANSTLEYPEKFEGKYREVVLKGEAFFDVVSNPSQPFVVKSGDLQTRVLGTSFNIRAFEDEEEIEVTVATGRVSVEQIRPATSKSNSQESVALLFPEQQLVYSNSTGESTTQQVDSRLFTSWKDGVLMFENHTFEEITRRLERWYGVEIQFADPDVKEMRFRIMFEHTSLEHALKMLQAIEDFEFETEGDQIWIR